MKKNGFTLIELLAVIIILAIIALIAVPIILNIINTAREESNKRSIELYANSVRNSIAAYQLTNPKPPKTFSDLTVEYKGDVECSVKELYSDGSFYLEGCRVNKSEKEYSYGVKQGSNKPCTLEDLDGDGKASLSDVVTCGTESFYVMTNENNEITMLSMYNLYVGNVATWEELDNGNYNLLNYESIENPTNKQSEIAKGAVLDNTIWYGTVTFSNENYWDPNNEREDYPVLGYDENSNLYQYITEYERILKGDMKVSSAKATVISYEELVELGCDGDFLTAATCGPDMGGGALENPAPEWVYSTSYWTGSLEQNGRVWTVYSNGSFSASPFESNNYNIIGQLGIRPVVTISTVEI